MNLEEDSEEQQELEEVPHPSGPCESSGIPLGRGLRGALGNRVQGFRDPDGPAGDPCEQHQPLQAPGAVHAELLRECRGSFGEDLARGAFPRWGSVSGRRLSRRFAPSWLLGSQC